MAKDRPVRLSFSFVFQIKYCLTVAAMMIIASGLLYLLLDRTLSGGYRESLRTLYYLDQNLSFYLSIMALLLTVFILVLTLVVTLLVSHQIAGPVFRYEDVLKQMIAGVFPRMVATRETDQLKLLVGSLNNLTDRCCGTFAEAGKLASMIEQNPDLDREGKVTLLEQVRVVRQQMGNSEIKRGQE